MESLTWEFALIGGVTGLALTYVLGLVLHIMQPVHLGISLLGGAVGYALGLIIWTPRARVHRAPREPSEPALPTAGGGRNLYRSGRRRGLRSGKRHRDGSD